MNRLLFLQKLGVFSIFSWANNPVKARVIENKLQTDIIETWQKSKTMTLSIIEQMPDENFGFKYTSEAMSFAEQFRHCAVYTYGQMASRLNQKNPFEKGKPAVKLNKIETIKITTQLYDTIIGWAKNMSQEELLKMTDFSGEPIPAWRLFNAMENHIIHHRGQAIVYLRLNGITPKAYYGW